MPDEPQQPTPREPVPYKDTGHPLRDWLAWRIANTEPGKPVFPVLKDLLVRLLGSLLSNF